MVEADETFSGKDPAKPKSDTARSSAYKMKVLSLVDRKTGRTKSIVVDDLTKATVVGIPRENIAKDATVRTDEAYHYRGIAADFAAHDYVRHSADK